MLKKYSLIAALLFTLGVLLTGATVTTAQEDVIQIAYLTKHLDNPWFVNETGGAQGLADQLGVELTIQDLQFDANLALSAMDTVIGAGVDGIIIVVPEQQIGPAVMQRAADAGIPIITVDDTIQDANGSFAPHVGFDPGAMGRMVAEMAEDFWTAEGWNDPAVVASTRVASIELQTLTVCMDRTNAAVATWQSLVPDFPEENILHVPYDGTLVGAIDVMAPIITANPDVTNWIVWSCNDDGVVGGVRALEQSGFTSTNVIGIGLNGHLGCDEWAKPGESGFRGTIYNNSAVHGEYAVMAMYNNIRYGVPLPAWIQAPGVPVTEETRSLMNFDACQQ